MTAAESADDGEGSVAEVAGLLRCSELALDLFGLPGGMLGRDGKQ